MKCFGPGNNFTGFTLIELLVVIAIIALLSSVLLTSIEDIRARARDSERISNLRNIRTGLEAFYTDKGYYPSDDGYYVPHGFTYYKVNPDGTCSNTKFSSGELEADNGASPPGLVEGLLADHNSDITESYVDAGWVDPLVETGDYSSAWNCRYITPSVEEAQSYLLHCNLEASSEKEANDGGTNDTIYEIQGGNTPWICIGGTYTDDGSIN